VNKSAVSKGQSISFQNTYFHIWLVQHVAIENQEQVE